MWNKFELYNPEFMITQGFYMEIIILESIFVIIYDRLENFENTRRKIL